MAGLRFGVVGTAYWASERHLPGLLATPGAEVAGLWGRSPAKVREIADRHGVTAFGSFDAMLGAVDAVTIAIPPQFQPELAIRAAQAGKHLLLEKPLAGDSASAHAVAAAVQRAGVASLVFFLRRFQPETAAALAAAARHSWTQADVRLHSSVMVSASPYSGSVWRQQAGGALWDVGPHVLSTLIPVLGDVTAVEAWPETGGIDRMHTQHAGGGSADISLSLRSPPGQTAHSYRFHAPERELVLPHPAIDPVAVFGLAAARLMQMAASGRMDDPCDVRLGARVVDVLSRADDSARSGRRLSVPSHA